MIAGSAVALVWMMSGRPLGIHGFIPGVLVSLVVFVVVSLFTRPPDVAIIERAWGEK
jgi:Na+/proline symporter